jgi:manganese/iron transport system permease protein/iron/zinc/copper transport system permease protein
MIAAAALVLLYKPLLFSTFDEEVAQVCGVPTRPVRFLFACILALTILAAMQVLGVTLVAAAVVIPAATARLLTHNFAHMLSLSATIGGATAFTGMYLSYYLDIASGASIVLFAAFCFACVLGFKQLRAQIALRHRMHPRV